jgi:hypothetical protein
MEFSKTSKRNLRSAMSKSSDISDGTGARIRLRGWAVMWVQPQVTGLTVAGCCYPTMFRPSATIGFNVWANSIHID